MTLANRYTDRLLGPSIGFRVSRTECIALHGKNGFIERSKILAGYRSEK